jgi:hypothetical protein
MEADHGVLDRRDEKALWVEPRLGHPIRQVVPVDQRLFGVMGECGCVDTQPLLLITAGFEGSDLDAGRDRRFRHLFIEPAFHDQQLALADHPGGRGKCSRCGSVTHRPDSQRTARLRDQALQQQSADTPSPMVR